MEDNLRKEQFNIAYVNAVAARAGFLSEKPSLDMGSVDIRISAYEKALGEAIVAGGRDPADAIKKTLNTIDLQLKATADQSCLALNEVIYPLPVKNYNDLRKPLRNRMSPIVLVVMILPERLEDWLDQTEVRMIARRCAYYHWLYDEPETKNTDSVTVRIPRANVFTVKALQDMMVKIAFEEHP